MLVAGGEPSLHPRFVEIMTRCCWTFDSVVLVTNGEWLADPRKEDALVSLMRRFPSLSIRFSSIEGPCRRCLPTHGLADAFVSRLKAEGVAGWAAVLADRLRPMSIGRASEGLPSPERDMSHGGATSCFTASLVAAQLPFLKTMARLEARGLFFLPLVDWRGRVHWSESWLCPSFGDVTMDSFEELDAKACSWRPCRRCAAHAKLDCDHPGMLHVARAVLGIGNRHGPEAGGMVTKRQG